MSITIKIVTSETSALTTLKQAKAHLNELFMGTAERYNFSIVPRIEASFKKYILKTYKGSINERVTHGCYGSTDGSTQDGFTFYSSLEDFTDRWIDVDGDEMVNPVALIKELCFEKLPMNHEAVEAFLEASEDLGLTVKRDNSYNWSGQSSEDPCFLSHFDFSIVSNSENDGTIFLAIKFHNGGDIRGNYSDLELYKINSSDDLYSFLYPRKELSNEEAV